DSACAPGCRHAATCWPVSCTKAPRCIIRRCFMTLPRCPLPTWTVVEPTQVLCQRRNQGRNYNADAVLFAGLELDGRAHRAARGRGRLRGQAAVARQEGDSYA